MRLLKRNKSNDIKIPKGWHEITIGQFEEAISHINSDDENPLRIQANVIASLTNKQPSDILAQPVWKINNQWAQIQWLKETQKEKFINEIELNGTTYVVNPDISKISADQFIFMNTILKEQDMHQRARLTALFVWPKNDSFKAESFNEIADLLYSVCPCSVMIPLSNFFFLLSEACKPVIEKHLASKTTKELTEIEQMIQTTIQEINTN